MTGRIRIFTTGGTIDKIYFDAKSHYQVGPPHILQLLNELDLELSYEVTSLMRKDSLELTDDDRECIRSSVESSPEKHILITHGTDSMVLTAKALSSIPAKTIVLTGALQPAGFKNSDAMFNIGMALGAVQVLDHGVYIAMNGRIFPADRVRKDQDKNRFTEISRES
jgi:L-asparaginase